MSTVPGSWAMPCSAQSFSSQSAPAPSRSDHGGVSRNLHGLRRVGSLVQQNAPAIFSLQQQVSAVPSKQDLHAVGLQILLDCQIDFLRFSVPKWRIGQSTSFNPAWIARTEFVLPDPTPRFPLHGYRPQIPGKYGRYTQWSFEASFSPMSSGSSPPTSQLKDSLPSEKAPAPEKPVVIWQYGLQFTHRPVTFFRAVALLHRIPFLHHHNFFRVFPSPIPKR